MSRPLTSVLTFVAVALAAGCGRSADFEVHGALVFVETSAPFAHERDFPARLETTLDAALRYWGGGWGALSGAAVVLSGEPYVSCGGGKALGCYDGDIRLTTSDPGAGTFDCVEQTVLVHEVGHAVIGDRLHEDPRWRQFEPLADALSGRPGVSARGTVDCLVSVSVWRHPAGQP